MPDLTRTPVNPLGCGTFAYSYGINAPGSLTFADITSFSLNNSASYQDIAMVCSCSGAARFQLVYRVAGVDTVIYEALTTAQTPTVQINVPSFRLSTPSSGNYTLVIKAQNINILNGFSATISGVQNT